MSKKSIEIEVDRLGSDVESVSKELGDKRSVRGDGINRFARGVRANKPPDVDFIDVCMKSLSADDRVIVYEVYQDLTREAPKMTDYEKKLISLGTTALFRGKVLENQLMSKAILGQDFTKSDERKIRLLEIIQKKEYYYMKHTGGSRRNQDSGDGLVESLMRDPEIRKIRVEISDDGAEDVADADWSDVEDAEVSCDE